MSKLIKSATEVVAATSIVDAIERACADENKPANIGPHDKCARCDHYVLHDESHCLMSGCKCKWFVATCKKCGGCGSVSVPGELADTTCRACRGTGLDDPSSEDIWLNGR